MYIIEEAFALRGELGHVNTVSYVVMEDDVLYSSILTPGAE